jgi:DNA invertase Pin-like site-specific DNA recombinase
MKKQVGIYLRVSTDSQTTENQRRELEAVAARSGWETQAKIALAFLDFMGVPL